MSSPTIVPPVVTVDPAPATTPAPPTSTPAPPPNTTPATTPPVPPPTTTPSPNPSPATSDEPQPTHDDPKTKTSTSRRPTDLPKPGPSGSGGTTNPPATGGSGNNNQNGTSTGGTSITDKSSKSVVGPVVGGIAAVLVLAFLIGVFVMRWRKKSRARKRLDELLDQSGQGHDQITSALGDSPSVGGAGKPRPSSIHSSVARPSNVGQMEMTAVGAGAGVVAQHQQQQQYQQEYQHDGYENYDYQQGYQQVPYGGYQDQYDQYDPYYNQQQPMAQGHQPTGYYSEASPHLQHQVQGQGQHGYTGSPSMTHSSASPSSYPQPPASNTAGSPRTPLQSATAQAAGGLGSAYDRFNKIELSDYANTQSPARNPQVIPEG
ncbi:hypothetical protein BGZ92_004903, partial [Podila epicladia]